MNIYWFLSLTDGFGSLIGDEDYPALIIGDKGSFLQIPQSMPIEPVQNKGNAESANREGSKAHGSGLNHFIVQV